MQEKVTPQWVRHIRTKVLRLSLQKMATAMGASRSSIVNWEQGKTKMLPAFKKVLLTIAKKKVEPTPSASAFTKEKE